MKKRIICLLLAWICLLALTGCVCNHQWMDPNCSAPATCTLCGQTEGAPLGHSWLAATCSAPKTCENCGETQGEALPHDWQDATCSAPTTCRDCGKTRGDALDHSWQDATCTQAKTCTGCGATEGAPLSHDWAPATATRPKTCRRCGATDGNPALNLKVGDTLFMGNYGNEPIEWIVLEFNPETNQALVISKYCLDAVPFHAGSDYGSWENSTLRRWLNSTFVLAAFTQEERASILTTHLTTPDNPDFETKGGNETDDQVFLLSYEEAVYYFPSRASRQGAPTAYCRAQGCYDPVTYAMEHGTDYEPEAVGYTWWWLRTPGVSDNHTCNVVAKGTASSYGALKTSNEGTIRPAMWIQLG